MSKLQLAYDAIDEKHGKEIVVLNMKNVSLMTDYMVITHATTTRQTQAIARNVSEKAHKEGIDVGQMEGFQDGRWILLDLGDVVVHIFQEEERQRYHLEKLWKDAPEIIVGEA